MLTAVAAVTVFLLAVTYLVAPAHNSEPRMENSVRQIFRRVKHVLATEVVGLSPSGGTTGNLAANEPPSTAPPQQAPPPSQAPSPQKPGADPYTTTAADPWYAAVSPGAVTQTEAPDSHASHEEDDPEALREELLERGDALALGHQ